MRERERHPHRRQEHVRLSPMVKCPIKCTNLFYVIIKTKLIIIHECIDVWNWNLHHFLAFYFYFFLLHSTFFPKISWQLINTVHKNMSNVKMFFNLLLIGMINWGITGNIFEPPCSSISWTPCLAKNSYGCVVSHKPSKNSGR